MAHPALYPLKAYRRAPYGARGLKSMYYDIGIVRCASRPVWGAWIEIRTPERTKTRQRRRAPYGARGLKSDIPTNAPAQTAGRAPYGARGLKFADRQTPLLPETQSRAPYGARGLKYRPDRQRRDGQRRAPYGARGLK